MNAILGSSMSSRLFIQLRERRGLAYYVRSGADENHDTGSLSAQAESNQKTLMKPLKYF